MAYPFEDAVNMSHRRHSVASNSPVNHTRKSWSNNGVHYTVETTSYSSPNVSFGMMGGTARSPFQGMFASTQSSSRPQNGGILGTAFGLLENVLAAQQQPTAQPNARRSTRRPSVDDLAYGEDNSNNQPRSFISKFAERLLNNSQHPRRAPRSGEHSPTPPRTSRTTRDGRSGSYRTEEREPSWKGGRTSYVEDFTDSEYESDSEDDELPREHDPRRAFTASDASVIEALQNAAEHHRRQARKCRERIQQISRQPSARTSVLQGLLNELKSHENAYESALQNLKVAKEGVEASTRQRWDHHQGRYSQHRQWPKSREEQSTDAFSSDNFGTFFQTRRTTHPSFPEFDEFDSFLGTPFASFNHLFTDFGVRMPLDDGIPHFFGMPSAAFGANQQTRSGFTANTHPRFHQPTDSAAFSVPPQTPPTTLLKPQEAKQLFKTYNERWNALAPSDPNIPYPARRLQPAALAARETLWAPLVSSPIATWSEEVVMQANAQAFFLGVAGLTPQYTETGGTGRVMMSYDKARASPAQVKELVEILKKEKTRWHSDRLGRRNGGMAGPNEKLQTDEKARAVFHAVCELMEAAQ